MQKIYIPKEAQHPADGYGARTWRYAFKRDDKVWEIGYTKSYTREGAINNLALSSFRVTDSLKEARKSWER